MSSHEDGMNACSELGEVGYMPIAGGANLAGLFNNTPVVREEIASVSAFWVRSLLRSDGTSCQAVTKNGTTQELPCNTTLPSLCFNTAPKSHFLMAATGHQIKVSTPKAGVLQGYYDQNSFRFLGIRYAKPPVGDLRFKAPEPYVPPSNGQNNTTGNQTLSSLLIGYFAENDNNTTVQDATHYGAVCPQKRENNTRALLQNQLFNQAAEDEDCLFLNVYTPSLKADNTNSSLPVMVYIHGGGFLTGSGSSPFFEPGNLVSRGGVVVVTFNYRLGILGSFQNVEGGIPATEAPGNLATRDQILALQWVHDNIASFGGNPNNVTLFGESAGGYSIRSLLATPSAYSLYKHVILQSDPVGMPLANTTSIGYITGLTMQTLGCNTTDIACARSKTADEILAAQYGALDSINSTNSPYDWIPKEGFYRPAVDHNLVMGDLFQLAGNGSYNTNATIMWGFTKDDGGLFVPTYLPNPVPPQSINQLNGTSFMGGFPYKLFTNASSAYPMNASMPDAVRSMFSDAATDWYFRCPLLNVTRSLAPHSRVYNFQFDYGRDLPPMFAELTNKFCDVPQRICHAADIIPSFASANYFMSFPQTGVDARFARQIVDRFTTFAKTGSPNPPADLPGYERLNPDVANITWDAYTPSASNSLLFQAMGANVTQNLDKTRCDYIEQRQPYIYLEHKP
ncbi:hypothetical protein BGW42_001369 [Actinomortierella wolfii]|nr:hypothetical protein BGW42_001369 [Actinomortierella wolfii]